MSGEKGVNMLTYELLGELFAEFEDLDLATWIANSGYNSEWTDAQIYNALPNDIKALVADIVMNESWYHEGIL